MATFDENTYNLRKVHHKLTWRHEVMFSICESAFNSNSNSTAEAAREQWAENKLLYCNQK